MTSPGQKQPLLKVKNIHTWLPTERGLVRAVDNVSFSLYQGRTFGLVGESGCGKSMLARTIMGLLPPNAQVPSDVKVEFKGRNLIGMPPKKMRRIMGREISIIFQDPMTSLNPVMKVGHQIAEVLRHHLGVSRQASHVQANALLDLVGIPMPERRAKQYPHQLSGGLRQRVAIAIALACEPALMIADEPTTALDVTIQAEILDLVAQLQKQKKMALLLISHDLGVVANRTDTTAVMYAGKIVEQAPTQVLFNRMIMPYTRALMNAIPWLENPPHTKLQTIDGQPPDLVEIPPGCRFAPRCQRVKSRCWTEEPLLRSGGDPQHQFACWYPYTGG